MLIVYLLGFSCLFTAALHYSRIENDLIEWLKAQSNDIYPQLEATTNLLESFTSMFFSSTTTPPASPHCRALRWIEYDLIFFSFLYLPALDQ